MLADDGAAGDQFGYAVAISGQTILVGAPSSNAGALYLFDQSTGLQIGKLLADDGQNGDFFGFAVAVSGTTAIVSAYLDDDNGVNSGSAYLFDIATGAQIAKLLPDDGAANDVFGFAVALSGTTAIVGATGADQQGDGAGAAYLFDITTGAQIAKLVASDGAAGDIFGVAVGISGATAIVGASRNDELGGNAGAAYLYDTTTGAQLVKLLADGGLPGDELGRSVAISGSRAIAGAYLADSANGIFGGAAHVFDVSTGDQLRQLLATDGTATQSFGWAVAISGSRAVVTAKHDPVNGVYSGSAYLYDLDNGAQLAKWVPSDGGPQDTFGVSAALDGSTAVVGANFDAPFGAASGSAYSFDAVPAAESYCSAGTSAKGCQATLVANGIPSSSTSSGFDLWAENVDGGVTGLFFFGTSGRQANAWGNGTSLQCVVPPVQRGGLLTSTGTPGSCDGGFSQDLNARWRMKPSQNPGPGAIVQAQLWYRDPLNTSNQTTNLSDAIEFQVCP